VDAAAGAKTEAPKTKAEPVKAKAEPVKAEATKAKAEPTKAGEPTKAAEPAPAPEAQPAATPDGAPAPISDETRQQAGALYAAGKVAFEAADFVTAEAKFREANALLPSPICDLMIAQSLDKQGKDAKLVVAAYDDFLLNPAASRMDPAKVSEAEARANELRKSLPAKYTFTTEPGGATVTIDGAKQEGVTPLTLELPAGKHNLEVTRDGYEKTVAEFEVVGGTIIEQPINLVAITVAPAETAATPAPREEPSMVPAYVTLGLGGAGLVVGTIFGILALDSKGKYNSAPSSELANETERNAIIADMSLMLAATLGVTGVVLLTGADKDAATAAAKPGRVVVAPYGNLTGGGASARVSF
jgi:hypothetical protein